MVRVVVVRDRTSRGQDRPDTARYGRMLAAAFASLDASGSAGSFLKSLGLRGTVGCKTNCLDSRNPTSPQLASALCGLLTGQAGVAENDVVIWERSNRELADAGYTLNAATRGIRCLGTDTAGVGYDETFYGAGAVNTLVSRVLTSLVDHSINLPVLKDHSIAGLSGGLKNMYGAIRNPNKYHGGNCDPYVADVNSLGPVRAKYRLTVIDAAQVQYDRGPGFDPRFTAPYGGVIVSTDPVAADAVGLAVVERLRRRAGLPALEKAGRPAVHIETAARRGLGTADLAAIDLRIIRLEQDGRQTPGELDP